MNIKTLSILLAVAGILSIPACQSLTATQKSEAIATVEKTVASIAADYAADGKLDEATAINTALQAISSLVAATSTDAEAKALVAAAVTEYTGDTSASGISTAQKIASAIASGLSASTTADKQATVVAAGVAASDAVQTVADSKVSL